MSRSFELSTPGTSEYEWSVSQKLDRLPAAELPATGARLVVVAAHPDDETLGAGGLMAAYARIGADICVIIATDGEASHPTSTTHSPAQLADIRRAEARAAIATVAPNSALTFLGLPDGGLAAHVDVVEKSIRAELNGPTLVLSPWLGDRHPDHEAAGGAARAAVSGHDSAQLWQYPIWAWNWARPNSADDIPWRQLRRIELSPDASASKHAALAEYRSQHAPLSDRPGDEAILPPYLLAHFERPYEVFVCDDPAPASTSGYFDELWAGSDDPWGLTERFYEHRKRSLLLASLPRREFARAFEPGCASGLLTAELAKLCTSVIATDVSARAVELATARLRDQPHVTVSRAAIPDDWPPEPLDLIVLSEVAYYCSDLSELSKRIQATLSSDGVLVACHWRRPAADHPHTADLVHAVVGRGLARIVEHREDDFLLDVWTREGRSVAQLDGITP